MQALARLGIAGAFGIFTVGVAVLACENALSVIRSFDDPPYGDQVVATIYEGRVVTIITAAFAIALSLLPAVFDRSLWWVGRNSCIIFSLSLFLSPVVFANLAFSADNTNFIDYDLGAELDLVLPQAIGIVASLAVMLLLGVAALTRRFVLRRRRMDPINPVMFD